MRFHCQLTIAKTESESYRTRVVKLTQEMSSLRTSVSEKESLVSKLRVELGDAASHVNVKVEHVRCALMGSVISKSTGPVQISQLHRVLRFNSA